MSYSATISFKKLNMNNLFSFLTSFKKAIVENLDIIAEEDFIYCPLIRHYNDFKEEDNYSALSKTYPALHEASKAWVDRLFRYRSFYNPIFDLIGIYGVPDCVKTLFDGTCYFQNSCDQDYERKDWDHIEVFENIFDKWQNVSDEVIISYLKNNKGYTDNEILELGELDYYRRSAAYDEIWEQISNTLFDDSSVTYISIFGYYDILDISSFLGKCFEKAKAYFLNS